MLLGKLTQEALKHDWIEYAAGISMFLGAFALIGLITYKKKWTYLWKEWFTSVDHKKIGIMYIFFSAIQLAKGLIDGLKEEIKI